MQPPTAGCDFRHAQIAVISRESRTWAGPWTIPGAETRGFDGVAPRFGRVAFSCADAYVIALASQEILKMARVTVEDCVDKVPNRFELVLLASHRSRMISAGAPLTIDRDNDKNPVVALREIADETVTPADLNEDLIHSLQKYVEVDEPESEAVPLIGKAAADDREEDTSVAFDRMSEEELLRGLESVVPPDKTEEF